MAEMQHAPYSYNSRAKFALLVRQIWAIRRAHQPWKGLDAARQQALVDALTGRLGMGWT